MTVACGTGLLGYHSGSAGTAVVDGPGSQWTASGSVFVGYSGSGALKITNGGLVSTMGYYGIGSIGESAGSTGVVTVDGVGSAWTSLQLKVGNSGSGTLNISGGGTVTTGSARVNSQSVLAIAVGQGSSFAVGRGSGTMGNDGTVRFLAGAAVTAGSTYSPISAGTWSGSGTYQAVGGTWDATSHVFTVSSVASGAAGSPVSIDTSLQQRMLITDAGSGNSLGASFLATTSSTPVSLTASVAIGPTVGGQMLNAWTCSTNYGSNPAYLSLSTAWSVGSFPFNSCTRRTAILRITLKKPRSSRFNDNLA